MANIYQLFNSIWNNFSIIGFKIFNYKIMENAQKVILIVIFISVILFIINIINYYYTKKSEMGNLTGKYYYIKKPHGFIIKVEYIDNNGFIKYKESTLYERIILRKYQYLKS